MERRDIFHGLKTVVFKAFVSLVRPLWGKGIGKISFIGATYKYLYHHLAVREVTTRIHGINMIIRTSEFDGISHELLYESAYEPYEAEVFRQFLAEGMTVVDVGANIGYYTLLAAKLVGDKGRVFAFEPEPQNYTLLTRNIELNKCKNVTAIRKAVSSKIGTADLFINTEAGAHGFLAERTGIIGVTTVETVSLDEYFKKREYPTDVIKIDVEGAELPVLSGMKNVIKKNDNLRIFTELFCSGPEKSGRRIQKYWHKLVEFGFKYIYLINEQERRLELIDCISLLERCQVISAAKLMSPNLLCSKSAINV
jgi:FkbM family methyltransferase